MHLFIGPIGEVSEATRAIQEVTCGVFFEKWNRRNELANEITTRATIWNNVNLTIMMMACTKTQLAL